MTAKKQKQTVADLRRILKETQAQLVHHHHFSSHAIHKAGRDCLMGSGVMLELTALGGRQIFDPIVIRDGLSLETIECLRRDIARSYDTAVEFKPKSV